MKVLILFFILVSTGFAACHPSDAWFTPGRFGMFYHWGLYTGGGSSHSRNPEPFKIKSVEEFERLSPGPQVVAGNMVDVAARVGARYITLSVFHSCGRFMPIYPSELPFFAVKTERDYLGAIIEETHRRGLKFVVYMPGAPDHIYGEGGPWILGLPQREEGEGARSERTMAVWRPMLKAFLLELKSRYGDSIDGFWGDGFFEWDLVEEVFPNALRIGNNQTQFNGNPPAHVSTTEFLRGTPDPIYNRPSALVKPNLKWGDNGLAPRRDYNEDIPTCNRWWHRGGRCDNQYTQDPTFWVKEMICSIASRRKWNYAMGLGPMLDGSAPEEFEPMLKVMENFMSWAHPAVYNTVGGEGAPLEQGWMNSGAFGRVTVSVVEPDTYYLFVTEPPTKWMKECLKVQHDWVSVKSIVDLRTGEQVSYDMDGTLNIWNKDWSDIEVYGAKVFKIILDGE